MKRVFLSVFFVCVVAILWACDMGAVEAKGSFSSAKKGPVIPSSSSIKADTSSVASSSSAVNPGSSTTVVSRPPGDHLSLMARAMRLPQVLKGAGP